MNSVKNIFKEEGREGGKKEREGRKEEKRKGEKEERKQTNQQ